MGVGKTSVGRRLAPMLGLPFFDADAEIELAAEMKISDIFEAYGEQEFRRLEQRVIERLLAEQTCVLATGGGDVAAVARPIRRQAIGIAAARRYSLKADVPCRDHRLPVALLDHRVPVRERAPHSLAELPAEQDAKAKAAADSWRVVAQDRLQRGEDRA